MKTFLVVLKSGEKLHVNGDDVSINESGVVYISEKENGNIAILIDVAMIVDESFVKKTNIKPPTRFV